MPCVMRQEWQYRKIILIKKVFQGFYSFLVLFIMENYVFYSVQFPVSQVEKDFLALQQ